MTMTPLVEDRVLPATKIVSAVIIPFLVAAFAVLYPNPDDTTRHFAWTIAPTMSSMVLGAVYLGGAYFFARVVRSTRWHTVAGGFLPVATFAGLMGVATILHWDWVRANPRAINGACAVDYSACRAAMAPSSRCWRRPRAI